MLWLALRLRCPDCGTRWLFVHWLKPRPACANCGQALEPAEPGEGGYLGALVLNFAIAELVIAVLLALTVMASWPNPPWGWIMYGGAGLAVFAPLGFFPFSKLLWLAVDLYFNPDP